MPYSSIDELPENTKSLPKHAKEIFLASFNSAIKQGNSEESAFRIAWSAVGKSYEKVGDKWQAIKNLQRLAMFMNVEILNTSHEAILQTLNRDIGGYYFPSEAFTNNVNAWSGIPIVYAIDHPDLKLFAENPKLALDKIKGRIVGQVTMPRVETVGHPRLMANMEIDDSEVNALITAGKISHSTGFIGMVNGKNVTSVTPNHVLVFMEDANNLPKDRGAFILNKEDGEEVDIVSVDTKKPYGDVEYADPGYQEDGVHRYPLDTEKHVRAAWSYINMPKNQKVYSADQLAKIKAKIESAAKKFGITIANMETNMTNKDYSKEDMDAMLDFMKANPGMMDKSTMDKMYAAMDGANQKEYMKGVLKDLQSHPEMMDDEMKSMMKGMKNKEQETKDTMGKEDELTKQLEISNKEKETLTGQVEGLKTEIANKTEQLKVFEQKEAERKKTETESRWQTIKNKIPKGLTHKPEDEASLRKTFEEQPQEFAVRMTEFMNKPELPGEEGKAIVNAEQDAKSKTGFTVGGAHTTEA